MLTTSRCILISVGFFAMLLLQSTPLRAAVGASKTDTSWDSTVTTLLATGMYGFNDSMLQGFSLHLQRADSPLLGISTEKFPSTSQAITFSYDGSSGLLEFSGGYILSQPPVDNSRPDTIFLGIEPDGVNHPFDPERSWFLALNLSHSYQVNDHLGISFGTKAFLLQNPFDTREGQLFSLLFSMPITYKNYLTITPALQWSRPLSTHENSLFENPTSTPADAAQKNIFYGGVSISFSY